MFEKISIIKIMERSRNFYKTIRLGYILISVLIGCIAYNSFYEWQEIEALELDNLNSNHREVNRQYLPDRATTTKQCHQKK